MQKHPHMLLIHVVGTQLLFVLVACNFGIAIAIGRRPVMVGDDTEEVSGGTTAQQAPTVGGS